MVMAEGEGAAARFALVTPPPAQTGGAAIAVVQLMGDAGALERALGSIGVEAPAVGARRLCDLGGVDRGVVARVSVGCVQLMPHGGVECVRALMEALRAGGAIGDATAPIDRYPEAEGAGEAEVMALLARARSPRAMGVLLAQCALARGGDGSGGERDEELARVLMRLVDPPSVVAIGGANIGKSTLLNALARRGVSVVSGVAGTTRDHVGVELVLDGLCVRWVDTPGLRGGGDTDEARAVELALSAARGADLIVACGDASAAFPDLGALSLGERACVRCGLRGDRGEVAGADVTTSALEGRGLGELAAAVRERLVPDEALARGGGVRWAWR